MNAASPWVTAPTLEDEIPHYEEKGRTSEAAPTGSDNRSIYSVVSHQKLGKLFENARTQLTESKQLIGHGASPSIIQENASSDRRGRIELGEIDAKIAAAEARTDTKFAEMMGELRVISQRMGHIETDLGSTKSAISSLRSTVIVTSVTSVLAIAALFYTALQYGNSMFSAGLDSQSIADAAARSVEQRTGSQIEQLNAQFRDMNNRLGLLTEALQQRPGDRDQDGAAPVPMPTPQN